MSIIKSVWLKKSFTFGDYILTATIVTENDNTYLDMKNILLDQIEDTKNFLKVYGDVLFETPVFIFTKPCNSDPLNIINQMASLGWRVDCRITI